MSPRRRSAADPEALFTYARETATLAEQLVLAAGSLGAALRVAQRRGFQFLSPDLTEPGLDPLGRELWDHARWVADVGIGFAEAGAASSAWLPGEALRRRRPGDPGPHVEPPGGGVCDANRRYLSSSVLRGPDGLDYALVVPLVRRGERTYNADDGLAADDPRVSELEGADPGWRTIEIRKGMERVGVRPNVVERMLFAAGATAVGAPRGSAASDLLAVQFHEGRAATLTVTPAAPLRGTPVPEDPPRAPHAIPDAAQVTAAAVSLAPAAINGAVAFAQADRGHHAAYEVTFQVHADGRRRALYRRAYVGFDKDGEARLSEAWVTGPSPNDQIAVARAPGSAGSIRTG